MCISNPEYYLLHLLLFNVTGLIHYTSHASYISHVTDFPKPVVKSARLLVRGSVNNERAGRHSYHHLLLQAGDTPESQQRHLQKVRSYSMGKEGRGTPEGTWGNRRGFSAMWVPNGNTQIPSCLGSHTSGLSRIPVFPFQPLHNLSKFLPSLGDKNLNTAFSHQLWQEFPAASYKWHAESLLNSVLDHYTGGGRVGKNNVKSSPELIALFPHFKRQVVGCRSLFLIFWRLDGNS